MRNTLFRFALLALVSVMLLTACGQATAVPTEAVVEPETTEPEVVEPEATEPPEAEEFVFGMLMVGPYNDHGWSQAHYDAGLYVEENLPGARMIYVDKVNPADRPGTTPAQLAEDLVAQGAQLVIFNSDDMKDSATEFAQANPDVYVIMASGDQVWADGNAYIPMDNMVNIMGRMEYGKMIAGCAAALTTQTGQIGYLGPLINDETRRLAASAYLGAEYCWTEYLGNDPADLVFKVTWIGFWFNIPGVTADPTQVADDFFNTGFDVVISGIDTTEALTEAVRLRDAGQEVWAIPYDYEGACEGADSVCLGVPYFNWGPAYLETIMAARDGTYASNFQWNAPDWADINNPDTSAVGFLSGPALGGEAAGLLDQFIAELAGGLNLWTGPINLQDGAPYLADGEVATDLQVWYLPQLLEGMEGQSVSE
ncbi:MAG: BMP family ABC transporter substrate-binding protein [Anaerolineales bacterium]|nr:BMP family ABC transporter substrate-binding protein [Anaerolineales bacterium]